MRLTVEVPEDVAAALEAGQIDVANVLRVFVNESQAGTRRPLWTVSASFMFEIEAGSAAGALRKFLLRMGGPAEEGPIAITSVSVFER
jgi:hypothetical protein